MATESEQTIPVDSIKVPEFDKHQKKDGELIGRNVVEITINMKAVGGVCNLVISVDCSLNYSHHKYNTKLYNRAKEIE